MHVAAVPPNSYQWPGTEGGILQGICYTTDWHAQYGGLIAYRWEVSFPNMTSRFKYCDDMRHLMGTIMSGLRIAHLFLISVWESLFFINSVSIGLTFKGHNKVTIN